MESNEMSTDQNDFFSEYKYIYFYTQDDIARNNQMWAKVSLYSQDRICTCFLIAGGLILWELCKRELSFLHVTDFEHSPTRDVGEAREG